MRFLSSLVVVVMLATGCGGSDSVELEGSSDEIVVLNAMARLTPAEVFSAVSPSVVFINVPSGTGSGVLLSSGYVVTSAHVVGHYPTVQLFTSAGALAEVPVYAKDWSTDLALIGPLPFDDLDGEIPALDVGSSAPVAIGDDVYLIGYPGEVERQPSPTMTSGILSRRRLTPCLDMTFLQTDAMLAPGQSGGVLVDVSGQVIGISGLGGFTESNFALVLAAEDVSAAIEELDEGSGSLASTERPGVLKQSAGVASYDSVGYLVTITEDQPLLSVTARSATGEDVWLKIHTWDGELPQWRWGAGEVDYVYGNFDGAEEELADRFFADDFDNSRAESLEVSLEPGVYVVAVGAYSGSETRIVVDASSLITPLKDEEPYLGKLTVGDSMNGTFSHHDDRDSFKIELQKGEVIRIQMVSMADPYISLYLRDELVASNDDAAIGLYGFGAEIIYEAKASGQYVLDATAYDAAFKTYVLNLDRVDTGKPSC